LRPGVLREPAEAARSLIRLPGLAPPPRHPLPRGSVPWFVHERPLPQADGKGSNGRLPIQRLPQDRHFAVAEYIRLPQNTPDFAHAHSPVKLCRALYHRPDPHLAMTGSANEVLGGPKEQATDPPTVAVRVDVQSRKLVAVHHGHAHYPVGLTGYERRTGPSLLPDCFGRGSLAQQKRKLAGREPLARPATRSRPAGRRRRRTRPRRSWGGSLYRDAKASRKNSLGGL